MCFAHWENGDTRINGNQKRKTKMPLYYEKEPADPVQVILDWLAIQTEEKRFALFVRDRRSAEFCCTRLLANLGSHAVYFKDTTTLLVNKKYTICIVPSTIQRRRLDVCRFDTIYWDSDVPLWNYFKLASALNA
jgi:hypothetical protein